MSMQEKRNPNPALQARSTDRPPRRSRPLRPSRIVVALVLAVMVVVSLFPFYWNLIAAFRPLDKIFTYPPRLLPGPFTLHHFARIPAYFPHFVRNIFNSLWLATLIPMIALLFNSMAGFAFAKLNFRGKRFLFGVVLATILVPASSGYIPLYVEMAKLKLVDSFLAIILPGMAGAYGVFLFRQAMYAVPDELMDAARIDGANTLRVYATIVVPLIQPMMITVYISGFIGTWNEYFWPFIALKSAEKLTFPVVLTGIQGLLFEVPWGTIMVGALILTIPTLIIFLTLSRYIVPDIFGGSVKG